MPLISEAHDNKLAGITASESEGTDNSSTEEHVEDVEDFSNNQLLDDEEQAKTPTPKIKKKKGPGRPKKGHSKVMDLPNKRYNTRNKASNSETTLEANKFVIEDDTLATSGMNTTFKLWADMCDAENDTKETIPPKHGNPPVDK